MSAFSPTTATTSAVVGQAPQGMRDMYERIVGRQKGSQVSRYLSRFKNFVYNNRVHNIPGHETSTILAIKRAGSCRRYFK